MINAIIITLESVFVDVYWALDFTNDELEAIDNATKHCRPVVWDSGIFALEVGYIIEKLTSKASSLEHFINISKKSQKELYKKEADPVNSALNKLNLALLVPIVN